MKAIIYDAKKKQNDIVVVLEISAQNPLEIILKLSDKNKITHHSINAYTYISRHQIIWKAITPYLRFCSVVAKMTFLKTKCKIGSISFEFYFSHKHDEAKKNERNTFCSWRINMTFHKNIYFILKITNISVVYCDFTAIFTK